MNDVPEAVDFTSLEDFEGREGIEIGVCPFYPGTNFVGRHKRLQGVVESVKLVR